MMFLEAMELVVKDVPVTLRRFMGNETLWRRFIMKFSDDPTFQELCEATQQMDEEQVERTAHTLKGIAANLGFDDLSQLASEMVAHGRSGRPELFAEDLEKIREEYERVLETIRKIED